MSANSFGLKFEPAVCRTEFVERFLLRVATAVYRYFNPPHPCAQPSGLNCPERVWRRHSAYLMQLHQDD
jgi:hypothetical protein